MFLNIIKLINELVGLDKFVTDDLPKVTLQIDSSTMKCQTKPHSTKEKPSNVESRKTIQGFRKFNLLPSGKQIGKRNNSTSEETVI